MAARHRARFSSVQIIRVRYISSIMPLLKFDYILALIVTQTFTYIIQVAEIKSADIRRQYIRQLLDNELSFPLPHRVQRTEKSQRRLFIAKRPTTFY